MYRVMLTGVEPDGFISAEQAVWVGRGADHFRTAAAQTEQHEGNQEDLQVRLNVACDKGYFPHPWHIGRPKALV